MNTDTPESLAACYDDEHGEPCVPLDIAIKLERERDDLQKAVNGLCEHFGVSPANTTLLAVEVLRIERERDEARGEMAAIKAMLLDPVEVELDMIRGNIAIPERPEFSGVYDTGKAMANLIRQRDEAREQRDRLAEALRQYEWPCSDAELAHHCASASSLFSVEAQREMKRREALQSLTTNELSNQ